MAYDLRCRPMRPLASNHFACSANQPDLVRRRRLTPPKCRGNRLRLKINFVRRFKPIVAVSLDRRKFYFRFSENHDCIRAVPCLTEGVSRSSRDVVRDAMDVQARETTAAGADGEIVWS
jgi:hypothetical protein